MYNVFKKLEIAIIIGYQLFIVGQCSYNARFQLVDAV
jgi:hypothetical protein